MKKYYCCLDEYQTREEAIALCDVRDLDTTGMMWTGERYYDRDAKESWFPVQECEVDENGDVEYAETIGYKKEA